MEFAYSEAPFLVVVYERSQVPHPSLLLHPHSTAASVCAEHRAKKMRTCPVIAAMGLGLPSVAGFVAPNVGVVRVSVSGLRQPPV